MIAIVNFDRALPFRAAAENVGLRCKFHWSVLLDKQEMLIIYTSSVRKSNISAGLSLADFTNHSIMNKIRECYHKEVWSSSPISITIRCSMDNRCGGTNYGRHEERRFFAIHQTYIRKCGKFQLFNLPLHKHYVFTVLCPQSLANLVQTYEGTHPTLRLCRRHRRN